MLADAERAGDSACDAQVVRDCQNGSVMMPTTISCSSAELSIELVRHGAELVSVRDARGREILWQAGPEWRRHAPVLFPIICRVPGDTIHHHGTEYPLSQHGFARDREFELMQRSDVQATFRLVSDEETRAHFPFDWTLEIDYLVEGQTLTVTQSVSNTGDEPLGASIGNHPAFAWPLPDANRAEHTIDFGAAEPHGFQRAPENLLLPELYESPLRDGVLALNDEMFEPGVLIFTEQKHRVLRYAAPGAPTIVVDSGHFTTMGVWAPVGAPFVCIEPWAGYPTPVEWNGEILEKPGQFRLEPGQDRSFSYSITVESS